MMGDTESKEEGGDQRTRWLDSITDSMDVKMSKLWEIVEVRRAWYTTVHEVAKSWTQASE